ncbi:hypothetical protein MRX96_029916 [Rhipicephalus microplus]
MYHPAQQMEEPLSRRGELSAHKRSMRLDLDNAGPSQPTSEQAHTSSPLPTPDLSMPLLTTPEFEMLLTDLKAPETPPMQTTVLPLNEEEKQCWSRFVDELSNLNLPPTATTHSTTAAATRVSAARHDGREQGLTRTHPRRTPALAHLRGLSTA